LAEANGTSSYVASRQAGIGPSRTWFNAALSVFLLLLCAACGGVLNPPIPTVTPVPTISSIPTPVTPTATPVPPQWVKNHHITEMWSGPASDRTAISFGRTSSTFCSFRIEHTEDDARIFVYNPYLDGRFWIDAEAVGPVQAPEHRRGPKPPDQNCAEAVYEAGTPMPPDPSPSPSPSPIP
jgi:hypothetical protein